MLEWHFGPHLPADWNLAVLISAFCVLSLFFSNLSEACFKSMSFSTFVLPWHDPSGWLGVKYQVTPPWPGKGCQRLSYPAIPHATFRKQPCRLLLTAWCCAHCGPWWAEPLHWQALLRCCSCLALRHQGTMQRGPHVRHGISQQAVPRNLGF